MDKAIYSLILIIIMSVIIAALRFFPFFAFPEGRKCPKIITYIGSVLPYAIMGMLVIYCFKGASVFAYPYGIPELIATAYVALIHLWKRNTMISIFTGVILYMVLVQLVFV